ncbi:hypothetical protein P154DRAFT_533403 [Amniculicola lignicola CBS 123094]|uniref:Uncharacterized protein n=1 Tax=Amniculicola lignicola CBS 123094 TaxID=1392246 RepID=A0A6A5WKZ4_9PLEO|nr:hypothetical protein P154DRAFT_533403 [Amniculicola lignicola CBS 123094]
MDNTSHFTMFWAHFGAHSKHGDLYRALGVFPILITRPVTNGRAVRYCTPQCVSVWTLISPLLLPHGPAHPRPCPALLLKSSHQRVHALRRNLPSPAFRTGAPGSSCCVTCTVTPSSQPPAILHRLATPRMVSSAAVPQRAPATRQPWWFSSPGSLAVLRDGQPRRYWRQSCNTTARIPG